VKRLTDLHLPVQAFLAKYCVNFQYSLNATLRSAFSWQNFVKKYLTKNIHKKKFQKIFREFFFQIFVGYLGSTANLGYVCENFGSLGPLVWEEN
jgi:hypothetical protein